MSYAELIIFTQPYCPHCELVKDQIESLKANNAGITHADLLPGAANKDDAAHKLATRYNISSTPSAVLIEGPAFQVYTGTEIFFENKLQDIYRAAQNRDPLKSKPAKKTTQTGTIPGDNPTVIVDPGPPVVNPPETKKGIYLGIAAAAALILFSK
ncbi:MAG: hypothetical protein IPI96_09700 [Saprospiraceae bacterium]|nr:hypothetical protein [Saprospiraceae bacterium]